MLSLPEAMRKAWLWQDGGPRDQHEWESTMCFKKEKQAHNPGENCF